LEVALSGNTVNAPRHVLKTIKALLLISIAISIACTAAAAAGEGDAPPAAPWLWKAQAPSGPPIWIIGVIHMSCPADARFFNCYLPLYRNAETIYFESLPADRDAFDNRRLLGDRGLLKDGRSLRSLAPAETWKRLEAAFSSQPGQLRMIDRMQPWYAAVTISLGQYSDAGLSVDGSLEAFLRQNAIRDRKPCGALELPEDEIVALADASFSAQCQMLDSELGHAPDDFRKLDEAWRNGDEAALRALLKTASQGFPAEIQKRVIEDRNRQWVRRLQAISRRGRSALVVVGVEHLLDANAPLPRLLEEAGFEVRAGG
jgi:uncharacterized protein YbaP (TraB family)